MRPTALVALLLTLVAGLPAFPSMQCRACPSDCAMHDKRERPETGHLGCHRAPRADRTGLWAGCGGRPDEHGVVQPWVLTRTTPLRWQVVVGREPEASAPIPDQLAPPPDPGPPRARSRTAV